jgi:hypothetical protein
MPQTYNDIYIRDNFGDQGTIPSPGNPCQSPDIIPFQNGTMTPAQLVSTYAGPDQGKSVLTGAPNNVYFRAKNIGTATSSGSGSLYYAKASLLLLPVQWIQATTASGQSAATLIDQNASPTIGQQTICFGNPPFLVQGPPAVNDHYCMIGVVNTPTHPITIPSSFQSNAAFAQWVQNNPAVGWRNISVVPAGSSNFTRSFVFGSTDPQSDRFYFRVIGRNFATGTPVTAQCTDAQCPINVSLTLPQPDPDGNQIAGFEAPVPANFSGTLTVNATSQTPFPTTVTFSIQYYKIPTGRDPLEKEVSRTIRLPRTGMNGLVSYIEADLVPLGECTLVVR